jgi:hypothetical protein
VSSDDVIAMRFERAIASAVGRGLVVTTADREYVGVYHDGAAWIATSSNRVSPVGAFLLDAQPPPTRAGRLQLVVLYPTLAHALGVSSSWLDGLFAGLGAPSVGDSRSIEYCRGLRLGTALLERVANQHRAFDRRTRRRRGER